MSGSTTHPPAHPAQPLADLPAAVIRAIERGEVLIPEQPSPLPSGKAIEAIFPHELQALGVRREQIALRAALA